MRDDLEGLAALLHGLHDLTARVEGVSWIYYTLRVADVEREPLESVIVEASRSQENSAMGSVAERIRQEGLVEGHRKILLRQIAVRFPGSLTPELERQVRKADQAQLDRWVDAILSAASLEALLAT